MTKEAENVALLRQAYSRWADEKGADPTCWTCIAGDDIAIRSLADGIEGTDFARVRRGMEGASSYLADLTRDWEMISFVVDEYIAQDDRVVAIGSTSWRNRATGKTASTPKVDVWRFRDGKAIDFVEYFDTASFFAAAQP